MWPRLIWFHRCTFIIASPRATKYKSLPVLCSSVVSLHSCIFPATATDDSIALFLYAVRACIFVHCPACWASRTYTALGQIPRYSEAYVRHTISWTHPQLTIGHHRHFHIYTRFLYIVHWINKVFCSVIRSLDAAMHMIIHYTVATDVVYHFVTVTILSLTPCCVYIRSVFDINAVHTEFRCTNVSVHIQRPTTSS